MLATLFSLSAEEKFNKNILLENVIQKIATGNAFAVGELYDLVKNDVFAFALSKTGNKSDAEDIMQDTFVNIYKHATQYVPHGKPMAWIITIELNLIRRHFQIAKRTTSLEEIKDFSLGEHTFEQKVVNNQFLLKLLSILNEEEREIISLHMVSGFKHREISRVLNKPLSTVLSKYNRAMKKLQQYVKEVKL